VSRKTLLVVEDGREYADAFERLASSEGLEVRIVRAAGLGEAREALEAGGVTGVFFDVVFDRVPSRNLAGPRDELLARSGGDRTLAERRLAESQGFYLLDALAPSLAERPVVIAWDFALEPNRLAALRERVPLLEGLADDASLSEALARFLRKL
jgi:hypothetical protein